MESTLLGVVVLDSNIAIRAERTGLSVRHLIIAVQQSRGELELSLSPVTVAELVHGIFRAKAPEASRRGEAMSKN